ncbi:hypothetical protein KUV80_13340 [Fictibacillus nanhaiensis]|uniref:hypothetical protein n=1 Tax=Fictibacillus nanhaiensis TaxID=742169 RepID=UPI001C9563FB|nr:hypothetical protein [Fictibacillus nanhaiensis]MBY6037648.1 hypothetical protein [Fictibacillus nanhaiensis]
MRIILSSVISIICGALFFFTIPGGNILEIDLQGLLFSLFFGVVTALPFFLFCTFPSAFIIESIATKISLRLRTRIFLYVLLSVLLILFYRYTIFYLINFEETNTYAVFGYGISCSLGFGLSYSLFKRKKKHQEEME